MNRRKFFGLAGGAALGTASLAAVGSQIVIDDATTDPATARALARRRQRFPEVSLVTHEGKRVRFYDDLVKDKTVLVNFMYTSCDDDCPLTALNLRKVQELLRAEEAGDEVFIYSISLDPEVDTPSVLANYARNFEAGPGWLFLTGDIEDITLLRRRFGLVDPDPTVDAEKDNHIGMVWFGVEPLERWAACPALSQPGSIADYVSWIRPGATPPLAQALATRPRGSESDMSS